MNSLHLIKCFIAYNVSANSVCSTLGNPSVVLITHIYITKPAYHNYTVSQMHAMSNIHLPSNVHNG